MVPQVPIEVKEAIVGCLKDCPETLRNLSTTSREFQPGAQFFLFEDVHIYSIGRLHRLYLLLISSTCTVPISVKTLRIELQAHDRFPSHVKLGLAEVGSYLDAVLEHFRTVRGSLSLQTPSLVSTMVGWLYLHRQQHLKRFVIG